MNQKLNAVIFDLGKVVFDYAFSNAYNFWSLKSSKSTEEIRSKFKFGNDFEDFESGLISALDFYKSVNRNLETNLSYEEFCIGWNSIYLNEYTGISKVLNDLKNKYKIVALTNTNELHKPIWNDKFNNVITPFEKVFCSHEIKNRKPNIKAYQIVLEYLQFEVNSVLFIDDNEANIQTARELGLRTILAFDFDQMKNEIEKIIKE